MYCLCERLVQVVYAYKNSFLCNVGISNDF